MMHPHDAGILSQSLCSLGNMMEVILKVCTAFGMTVSEAKAETMCLHGNNTPTVEFSVYAAGQVCKRKQKVYVSWGDHHRHTQRVQCSRNEYSVREGDTFGTRSDFSLEGLGLRETGKQ